MKHGRSGYSHHNCRCDICKAAHTRAKKEYTLRKLRGIPTSYPLEQVRDHYETLRASGLSLRQIARAAGISKTSLERLNRNREAVSSWVSPRVAEALFSVNPNEAEPLDGRRIDAGPTKRRIQALVAIGYTLVDIEGFLGAATGSLSRLLVSANVTYGMSKTIAALYEDLENTPAPEGRTQKIALNMARKKGWHPPAAWDDIENDTEPATTERDTNKIDLEDIRHLMAAGYNTEDICRRLKVPEPRLLVRAALRRGDEDLATRITRRRDDEILYSHTVKKASNQYGRAAA